MEGSASVVELPQATRLRVNINTFPCLSFVRLGGSSPGLSAHFLDTQGRVDACLLGLIMHKENGRKQKRNVDARLPIDGEVNRMTTEDRSRSGHTEWRPAGTVITQRGEDFSLFPPLHWSNHY